MIGIACYFGGEVLQGPNGAYYSHQMPKMFNIGLDLDFRGLNREVYRQLGIDHHNYELIITARINIGQGNQTWFLLGFGAAQNPFRLKLRKDRKIKILLLT